MSKYSGKCDVCDFFSDRTDNYIKNSKFYIYINGREHKLNINNHYDLMPYYPFLISSGGFSNNDDEGCTIFISSDSFVDQEEQKFLEYDLHDVIRVFNRCKRNKIPFIEEDVYKELNYFNTLNEPLKEIIKRIAENGTKISLEGIHREMQEYYRTELYRDMVEAGYDELGAYRWVFKEHMYFDNNAPKTRLYDFTK